MHRPGRVDDALVPSIPGPIDDAASVAQRAKERNSGAAALRRATRTVRPEKGTVAKRVKKEGGSMVILIVGDVTTPG